VRKVLILKNNKKSLRILRWTARITAALAAGLILIIFIGEGLSDGIDQFLHLAKRETLMMVAFIIFWLGLIVGWKWELAGGIMSIGGLVAFYLIDYLFSGTLPGGPFFLIFAVPGFIFLYLGIKYKE
jgi:hypothetical protein